MSESDRKLVKTEADQLASIVIFLEFLSSKIQHQHTHSPTKQQYFTFRVEISGTDRAEKLESQAKDVLELLETVTLPQAMALICQLALDCIGTGNIQRKNTECPRDH